jgi:hypothetical protein
MEEKSGENTGKVAGTPQEAEIIILSKALLRAWDEIERLADLSENRGYKELDARDFLAVEMARFPIPIRISNAGVLKDHSYSPPYRIEGEAPAEPPSSPSEEFPFPNIKIETDAIPLREEGGGEERKEG